MTIERLNGEEQLMLDASQRWPQDIGALLLLDGASLFDADGRFDLERMREVVASRLHLVPRFRQLLRVPPRGRGAPYWTDAAAFDLAQHVRERKLEASAGEPDVLAAVEELRGAPLDHLRPLWEMWFLTGLPGRRVVMFVKIHHTVADGMAAMTIVTSFMERNPTAAQEPALPWTPSPGPRPSALVADNIRRRVGFIGGALARLAHPVRLVRGIVAALPSTVEVLADEPGDETSLDRIVGEGRRLALVRGSYAAVRRVARAHRASVNDVLLSVTAAGLRKLLISRGEPVDGVETRIYVPVSLRRRLRGPQQGTNVAQMAVPLVLDGATPAKRLARIAADTSVRKALPRPPLDKVFRGRLATKLLLKLVIAQRVNTTSASIPGPRRIGYLATAPVLEVYPVLPLLGNQPLGVGAVSYADVFGIGIIADRNAIPDLGVLAEGIEEELKALEALAPPRQRPTAVTA